MSYVGSLKTYIRVYELGNMSAAARDQRISPAVASSRIAELERALAAKDAQNRELLRAKIDIMRKQLEIERSGSKLQFN